MRCFSRARPEPDQNTSAPGTPELPSGWRQSSGRDRAEQQPSAAASPWNRPTWNSPDSSRRPEQSRATSCRNSANAIRRGMHSASVCSLAERPKFRQKLCLLVPAGEAMNNAARASSLPTTTQKTPARGAHVLAVMLQTAPEPGRFGCQPPHAGGTNPAPGRSSRLAFRTRSRFDGPEPLSGQDDRTDAEAELVTHLHRFPRGHRPAGHVQLQ